MAVIRTEGSYTDTVSSLTVNIQTSPRGEGPAKLQVRNVRMVRTRGRSSRRGRVQRSRTICIDIVEVC